MDHQKKFNLVAFLDPKKAFDTANHDILLQKLELYGITGNALSLLQSYLSQRTQKCQLGDKISSEMCQSSILGPLLFVIESLGVCDGNGKKQIHFCFWFQAKAQISKLHLPF